MKRIINRIIQKLGRKHYAVDKSLATIDLSKILFSKVIQVVRGSILRLFVKQSDGFVFLGKNAKIRFRNKISLGRTIIIGDNVEINALSIEGVFIGNNVSILRNTIIECTGVIRDLGIGLIIGNNVGIAQNCFIQVRGRVVIGNNVIFGPGVSIFSENHNFSDSTKFINEQGETRQGVTIEDGVWIGTRAVILDGVTVGKYSVVAAGSIVTKDVPPYVIVGGIPARIMKNRKIELEKNIE